MPDVEAGPTAVVDQRSNLPHFKRLTFVEASRALYLDFEGNIGKPPVLIGVLRRAGRGDEPFVQQDIVDECFRGMGLLTMSLQEAVAKVVVRAEHGDRRIVSWSQHDLDVIRALSATDPGLVERFEARYANALSVAKRWMSRFQPESRPTEGSLAAYLELIEYGVPDDAAPGFAGETLRVLRARLEAGRPLTENQRRRWHRLLAHNRHDCAGMKRICVRATRDIDAADASAARSRPRRSERRQSRATAGSTF
jgi:hypothetical protein